MRSVHKRSIDRPKLEIGDPPGTLTKSELEVWVSVSEYSHIENMDRFILYAACKWWTQYLKSTRQAAKRDPKQSEAGVASMVRAFIQFEKCLDRLGMNPKTRARMLKEHAIEKTPSLDAFPFEQSA